MDEKKYHRLINHPRHIPSVHNYCDRWCERCPLTLRCSVYAVGAEIDLEEREHQRSDESLWPRLARVEGKAAELLVNHADHAGVAAAKNPRFKSARRALDASSIGAAAKRYMEFAYEFLVRQEQLLTAMTDVSEAWPVSPREAFEIIAYYHMSIVVKLSRALQQKEFEREEDDPELAELPSDSDGSAKISLILIDRSIVAWAVCCERVPAIREAALSAMATLNRLRIAVEKRLPNARSFVRPGFDTLRFGKP